MSPRLVDRHQTYSASYLLAIMVGQHHLQDVLLSSPVLIQEDLQYVWRFTSRRTPQRWLLLAAYQL